MFVIRRCRGSVFQSWRAEQPKDLRPKVDGWVGEWCGEEREKKRMRRSEVFKKAWKFEGGCVNMEAQIRMLEVACVCGALNLQSDDCLNESGNKQRLRLTRHCGLSHISQTFSGVIQYVIFYVTFNVTF